MNKPTTQEIGECIAYFKGKEIYAYEDCGRVFVNFDLEDMCVEISSAEVSERAELYRIENGEV